MSTRYCKCGIRFKDEHQRALSKWLPHEGVLYEYHIRSCPRCDYIAHIWIKSHSTPENDMNKVGRVIWLES